MNNRPTKRSFSQLRDVVYSSDDSSINIEKKQRSQTFNHHQSLFIPQTPPKPIQSNNPHSLVQLPNTIFSMLFGCCSNKIDSNTNGTIHTKPSPMKLQYHLSTTKIRLQQRKNENSDDDDNFDEDEDYDSEHDDKDGIISDSNDEQGSDYLSECSVNEEDDQYNYDEDDYDEDDEVFDEDGKNDENEIVTIGDEDGEQDVDDEERFSDSSTVELSQYSSDDESQEQIINDEVESMVEDDAYDMGNSDADIHEEEDQIIDEDDEEEEYIDNDEDEEYINDDQKDDDNNVEDESNELLSVDILQSNGDEQLKVNVIQCYDDEQETIITKQNSLYFNNIVPIQSTSDINYVDNDNDDEDEENIDNSNTQVIAPKITIINSLSQQLAMNKKPQTEYYPSEQIILSPPILTTNSKSGSFKTVFDITASSDAEMVKNDANIFDYEVVDAGHLLKLNKNTVQHNNSTHIQQQLTTIPFEAHFNSNKDSVYEFDIPAHWTIKKLFTHKDSPLFIPYQLNNKQNNTNFHFPVDVARIGFLPLLPNSSLTHVYTNKNRTATKYTHGNMQKAKIGRKTTIGKLCQDIGYNNQNNGPLRVNIRYDLYPSM